MSFPEYIESTFKFSSIYERTGQLQSKPSSKQPLSWHNRENISNWQAHIGSSEQTNQS